MLNQSELSYQQRIEIGRAISASKTNMDFYIPEFHWKTIVYCLSAYIWQDLGIEDHEVRIKWLFQWFQNREHLMGGWSPSSLELRAWLLKTQKKDYHRSYGIHFADKVNCKSHIKRWQKVCYLIEKLNLPQSRLSQIKLEIVLKGVVTEKWLGRHKRALKDYLKNLENPNRLTKIRWFNKNIECFHRKADTRAFNFDLKAKHPKAKSINKVKLFVKRLDCPLEIKNLLSLSTNLKKYLKTKLIYLEDSLYEDPSLQSNEQPVDKDFKKEQRLKSKPVDFPYSAYEKKKWNLKALEEQPPLTLRFPSDVKGWIKHLDYHAYHWPFCPKEIQEQIQEIDKRVLSQ